MKSLNVKEIESLVDLARGLEGAPLQDVLTFSDQLALGFWTESGKLWLLIDLNVPLWLPLKSLPSLGKATTKPISLFLKSNFKDHTLRRIFRDSDQGRVVRLEFDHGGELEINLVPSFKNIRVFIGEKKISWNKPKEMKASAFKDSSDQLQQRSLEELVGQWQARVTGGSKFKSKNQNPKEKLKKTMEKMRMDIDLKKSHRWQDLIDFLNQAMDGGQNQNEILALMDPEWIDKYYDRQQSVSWNLDHAYHQLKEVQQKISRAESKLKELQQKMESLTDETNKSFKPRKESPKSAVHKKVSWYSFPLDSNMSLWVGKNAKENLLLLRKSQPWDLWLHLRDYPGAHGLIHRTKNTVVNQEQLQQAAKKVIERSFKSRAENKKGEAFDVIVAERRHITPIKGDRLGRVRVKQEKVLRVVYE